MTSYNAQDERRRWTPEEEHELLRLREDEAATYATISHALHRSVTAVQQRYRTLCQKAASGKIAWTPSLDSGIISGRRRGLTSGEIATEMQIPPEAVQERWYYLRTRNKVPEDVMEVVRKRNKEAWTEEQDRQILTLWIQGMDDGGIVERVLEGMKGSGKGKADILRRRRVLTRGSGLYLEMLGVEGKTAKAEGKGVGDMVGEGKYAWQK